MLAHFICRQSATGKRRTLGCRYAHMCSNCNWKEQNTSNCLQQHTELSEPGLIWY